ncbi:Uncharacterised protein [Serratia marcescens]|nr:DUF551 domain-containing protein [Serratia marcescens]CVF69669.1 Uncharacterised protein [Serratia marcescens]
MTLTTERLREIASSPSFSANPLSHEVKYMARELLANREAQQNGWIACSERMPEDGDVVLVCQEGGIIFCAEMEGGCFILMSFPECRRKVVRLPTGCHYL